MSQALLQSSESSRGLAAQRQYLDTDQLDEHFTLLYRMLRRSYLTYYPSLARLAGSPKAGLMLGHALYYSKQLGQSQPAREGWFYMRSIDWFKATGLSLREQESARQQLVGVSPSKTVFLDVERLGMPARLWYRVKLDTLCQAIGDAATGLQPSAQWALDAAAMKVLLGRVVVFYAELAHLTGSASAGIYLSQLVNEYQFRASHQQLDGQGYAVAQDASVWSTLFLGEKAVRNAREQAEAAGWAHFKRASRRGGDLMYRINTHALTTAVSRFDLDAHCAKQLGFALSADQVLRKGQNLKSLQRQSDTQTELCFAQNAELGFAFSADQVTRKGQNLKSSDRQSNPCFALSAELGFAQNAELGFALFAEQVTRKGQNPIRVVKNTNNLLQRVVEKNTAAPKIEQPSKQPHFGGGSSTVAQKQNSVPLIDLKQLYIPSFILAEEYPTLETLLSKSKDPQVLLDELLGISKTQNIKVPCAYLRTLLNKEQAGQLIITHAYRVAAKRSNAAHIAATVAASNAAADSAKDDAPSQALDAAQLAESKARFAAMRESINAKVSKQQPADWLNHRNRNETNPELMGAV
jgi:hypothetical protein